MESTNPPTQTDSTSAENESAHILVVDDVEANRDSLSRRLRRRGYEVSEAAGGREALQRIEDNDYDLILLDVMMPDVDGLEVLRAVRKTYAATELPIIMATAKTEAADIVEALDLGANDYVTKPLDFPVVFARVKTQLQLRQAVRRAHNLEQRLRLDLQAAAKVQASLLPPQPVIVPGFNFAWTFRPCEELAGDALNVCKIDDDHVVLYVLDVSGHGVAASLLAVTVTRLLAPSAGQESLLLQPEDGNTLVMPPAKVADRLAVNFPFDPVTEQFFTLIYGVLNISRSEFRYVSAGHPAVVHIPKDAPPQLLPAAGLPIGLGAGYEEQLLKLAPGDRLYLYSDGILEAMNAEEEQFGEERMLPALEQGRSQSLAETIAELEKTLLQWCGDIPLKDDISILALEVE